MSTKRRFEPFTEPVAPSKEKSFAKQGITTFHGHARFVGETSVDVDGVMLYAERVVIATGARPMDLRFEGHEHVVLSNAFLELETLPSANVFVVGGYVSFALAHVAARFGAEVHIVERVDERAAKTASTQAGGPSTPRWWSTAREGCRTSPVSIERDRVATAKNGGVLVDANLRSTTNRRVYAAGDVAASGHPALTPVSSAHAHVVAENILHDNLTRVDLTEIPTVVFSIPPLASVGLTEADVRETLFEVCAPRTRTEQGL